MLDRTLAAAVPAAWVVADEAYGDDEPLRRWLESQGQACVLAVSSNHRVWRDMAHAALEVTRLQLTRRERGLGEHRGTGPA